jgi:hypothetical protein
VEGVALSGVGWTHEVDDASGGAWPAAFWMLSAASRSKTSRRSVCLASDSFFNGFFT